MTKIAEFAALDPDELANRITESRRELLNLRFQLATGQLDNYARLNTVRRDVARLLTVLREREIAEAEGIELPQHPLPVMPVPARRRGRAVRNETEDADETDEDDDAAQDVEEFDDEADEES